MRKGFTLVELIIVMLILAALAGAVIPVISTNQAAARNSRILADLEAIKSACYVYRADVGAWPATIAALSTAGPAGYAGPYLDRLAPTDPCGTVYAIVVGPPMTVTNTGSTCGVQSVQVHQ